VLSPPKLDPRGHFEEGEREGENKRKGRDGKKHPTPEILLRADRAIADNA